MLMDLRPHVNESDRTNIREQRSTVLTAAINLRNGTTSFTPGKPAEWYSVKVGPVVTPELIAIISTNAWALASMSRPCSVSEGRVWQT
jgi:hypothetical protein